MPNPKQPKKKIVDSLRKQEEKQCRSCNGEGFIMAYDDAPGYLTKYDCSLCKNTGIEPTPKVAISETNHIIKSIDFPGGKVKLLDGYKGEFQIEFSSVATSEKEETFEERTARKLDEDILSQFTTFKIKTEGVGYGTVKITPTPHESEEWEAEFDKKYKKMVEELYPDYRESYNYKILKDIKDFIRKEISKAYQRGKVEQFEKLHERIPKLEEEAYQRGREYTMNDLLKQAEKAKEIGRQEVLSLAVQEIEKEKKETTHIVRIKNNLGQGRFSTLEEGTDIRVRKPEYEKEEDYKEAVGFNAGLDKAKSIISGVMKK